MNNFTQLSPREFAAPTPTPLSRPRAAASYCLEKFSALPNRFDLGGVI